MVSAFLRDRFVATRHGRIHYFDVGEAGEPLVLLHSNGWSAHEYADVIEPLAARHRVIVWDMPGHGDSGPIDRHYGIGDYADAVVAFLDALSIPAAHVLGSSVGGSICIDLGARQPDRLLGLLIVETPTRSFEQWGEIWPGVEQTFAILPQTREQVAPRLVRPLTPELLARWNIDRNKAGGRVMMDVMWAIREFDVAGALPSITTRSVVVFGDKGPVLDGRAVFARYLPAAAQVVLPQCGHFPMLDDPEGFVRAVLGFTGRQSA